ncbi:MULTISPECIES: PadR family transcriptional regulator [Corynebacterium]|uniref:PadR family transcriptional regulator n=1 Tax=Corynebacterium gottingense TaxID=2041036 RepID=A0ABX9UNB0_9CORY|nr:MULTISPECIES: PadR family transcriptional regulator [Corynebacterium]RMD20540.1 PadR family transcriptional regulator [Corynebacterium gottingense]
MTFPQPWIRAFMSAAVLRCLADGPAHGYAIAQSLESLGFGRPKGGSLYPVLGKLENADLIEAHWAPSESGPGRKTYSITTKGKAELFDYGTQLDQLRAALRDGPARTDPTNSANPTTTRKDTK